MIIIHRIYRKLSTLVRSFRSGLLKISLFLVGQIYIHKQAVIDPKARFEVGGWSKKMKYKITVLAKTKIKNNVLLAARSGFIKIGNGCSINPNCILLGYGGITIGDNVRIAANTSIIAFNHNFKFRDVPIVEQGNNWKGIRINDDVWIGTGVRILDGVEIGKGAVIGAGSVVVKNVPEFAVIVGVPGKVIKYRE